MHHRMPPSKTGWPSLNVVIFPPVMRLVLDDPKQWPPWANGHLTWAGWVHHSWRFRHAVALREVGSEMPERGSKRQGCQSSEQLLEFFRRDANDLLSWLVTMDKTWLYHYDPETKQQSMEWRHSGSPRPQKFRVQKSAGKVLASIFWDQGGILLIDYLPKGQTINAEYYSSLLVQLKYILK